MTPKRRLFHPVWEKDAPLREERILFAKMAGIGGLLLLPGLLLLLWSIADPQIAVLPWIAGLSGVAGVAWIGTRVLPLSWKLAEQQKKAHQKGEGE